MLQLELLKFSTAEALAAATAIEWLEALERRKPGVALYTVALSGGRIAGRIFSVLARSADVALLREMPVHFFWADERCVPPGDVESNYGLAWRGFLESLQAPDDRLHRIRGEIAPKEAATQAEAELRRIAAANPDGHPVLDLVLLGMGEDGHVASLFPGEPEQVRASQAVFRPVTATKPPANRITLGYSTICAAREVWVVASGPGKDNALRQALSEGSSLPLARVLRGRSRTRVLTDIRLEDKAF